jgi:hypothetical protein
MRLRNYKILKIGTVKPHVIGALIKLELNWH